MEILSYANILLVDLKYKNPKDDHGETPLHWAAEKGHYDVCKLILENDGYRNPKDDKGITPLHLAAGANDLELCKLIINNLENDKNPKHLGGWTPFHYTVLRFQQFQYS